MPVCLHHPHMLYKCVWLSAQRGSILLTREWKMQKLQQNLNESLSVALCQ